MEDLATSPSPRDARMRRLLGRSGPRRPHDPSPIAPSAVVLTALWAGLVTGLLELLIIVLKQRWVNAAALGSLQLNRHAIWMIPASDLMILGTFGLIAGASALLLRRWRWATAVGLYGTCFLSSMALVLTYRGLTTVTY